jgi:hypothetical protein
MKGHRSIHIIPVSFYFFHAMSTETDMELTKRKKQVVTPKVKADRVALAKNHGNVAL